MRTWTKVEGVTHFSRTYSTAQDFLNAYVLLQDHNNEAEEAGRMRAKLLQSLPPEYPLPFIGAPAVVCLAFAVELFFKALIMLSTGKEAEKEHRISELFKALPEDFRTRIRTRVAGMVTEINAPFTDFDKHLGLISRGFVEWRYPRTDNVGRTYSPQFALMLVEAIQSIVSPKGTET